MSDLMHQQTNKQIKELDKRIHTVYTEAKRDIQKKLDDFNKKYQAKEAIHAQEVKDGKWTQEQFDNWKRGQVFQTEQWKAKCSQIVHTLTNSNKIAVDIINGKTQDVFASNATYMNYSLEHGAGVNFGFGIYDSATVAQLLKDDPQLLPEWKIDEPKDYIWNQRQVNNAVTQGIIQGEKLDQISKRIYDGLVMKDENLSKTFARTAMTQAQNSGRLQSLKDAKDMGIEVYKQWMATLDSHTRDSHADVDGESVPVGSKFSNGLEYPAEAGGPPAEVYNCRCTMVGDLKKYPAKYQRYDNIDGKPIENMSYREWEKAKIYTGKFTQVGIGTAKTVEEVNDILNNAGVFTTKADLTGCDLDSAKSIAAAYEQVFTKFPMLKGQFEAPDAHPVGMKKNTYAWCYLKNRGKVQVNPAIYNNWQKILKRYEQDVLSRWHPHGTTAESIVTHEIGHAIDGLLARKGILGGVTSSGEYRYASSSLKNTIMQRIAKNDPELKRLLSDKFFASEGITKEVSRYATKNNREWFAECFAEYITSANPRRVAAEFGKELEKLLGRLK